MLIGILIVHYSDVPGNICSQITHSFKVGKGVKIMNITDKLYEKMKNIDKREVNLSCPSDVWRLWINEESETWKEFVWWYKRQCLGEMGKENDKEKKILQNFFSGYRDEGEIEAFVDDWVADNERESFFFFYGDIMYQAIDRNLTFGNA